MVLFVGDRPSKLNTDPKVAFKGAKCEARLDAWIIETKAFPYYVINSTDQDALALIWLFQALGAPIVAIGNNASKYLNKEAKASHFKLPHPSGRNRQINDKAFINNKLEECKKYLQKT